MKVKSIVVCRVKEVTRPISGQVIGYRMQAAIPNRDANRILPTGSGGFYATGEKVPSFAKKYLVLESGDFLTSTEAERNPNFFETLRKKFGFTHWVGVPTKSNPCPELIKL